LLRRAPVIWLLVPRRLAALTLLLVAFAAGVSAARISAGVREDGLTTTTSTVPTDSTTTAPATTTVETPSPTTVTETTGTTTTAPAQAVAALAPASPGHCVLVGAVALVRAGSVDVIGPAATAKQEIAESGYLYPADGSIVRAASLDLTTSGCSSSWTASVHTLTLFSGAITVRSASFGSRGSIDGLRVQGRPVTVTPGKRLALGNWGYVVVLPPPAADGALPTEEALAVHLTAPHAGLAADTVVLVSFATLPAAQHAQTASPRRTVMRRQRHRRHQRHAPLKATPPLGQGGYIFPVVGASAYVDTYGAFRSDVPGNWHHGDDIFAPLGTPVVAVAGGTLNRAGWEKLGGWRLWVRDKLGNEFYYAHLSGYSPQALHSTHVVAGEVVGFIGNTGDAFTTSSHLHFEIHPRPFLHLHYNGAVDPTGYLRRWRHLATVHIPRPVHPPFPTGPMHREATTVWRELLVARGLEHRPAKHQPSGPIPLTDPMLNASVRLGPAASRPAQRARRSDPTLLAGILPAAATAVLVGVVLTRRRRRD
jgi:murein DD-endopeptidase MepM/ murein hydrolase activator NlpD